MSNQNGLEWIEHVFHGLIPRWTKEPDIDTISCIARKHLECDEETPCEVEFHAEGAFNKIYRVSISGTEHMLRVSLPVDPHHKTESEVATIEHVRRQTDMPVPQIIAFDSDNSNELGFEWILMEKMPGTTLRLRWRKMTWAAKEEIVKQCAKHQSQLFQKQFDKIGNIFPQSDSVTALKNDCSEDSKENNKATIGRIVSLIFFWGDHLTHDTPRGPFETSLEWLQTRLNFTLKDQDRILATSEDEDDIEDAENTVDLGNDLAELLPTIFSPDPLKPERTILFHDDLSMQNILVDEQGKLTAVIDWECVSALPLWRACQFPEFLQGGVRDETPLRESYMADTGGSVETDLDNEGINRMYWDHLLEYEQMKLREVFLREMETLSPEWVLTMKESAVKADFDAAVHGFDGLAFNSVRDWIDDYNEGKVGSLMEKLNM
jgi:hypothetical protein